MRFEILGAALLVSAAAGCVKDNTPTAIQEVAIGNCENARARAAVTNDPRPDDAIARDISWNCGGTTEARIVAGD